MWFSKQRYQHNRQMVKAGIKEPSTKLQKKSGNPMQGDFHPRVNDHLAVDRHLKALDKELKSRNQRPGVLSTLMTETQLYREAEIQSLDDTRSMRQWIRTKASSTRQE